MRNTIQGIVFEQVELRICLFVGCHIISSRRWVDGSQKRQCCTIVVMKMLRRKLRKRLPSCFLENRVGKVGERVRSCMFSLFVCLCILISPFILRLADYLNCFIYFVTSPNWVLELKINKFI